MRVSCLLFGAARQAAGVSEAELDLPDPATAGDVLAAVAQAYPSLSGMAEKLSVAVNRKLVRPDAAVGHGDEVALLPPMGGGGPGMGFSASPLDTASVMERVARPGAGGIVIFVGTVRDESSGKKVAQLEYEAYESMAAQQMTDLARDIEEGIEGVRVAGMHRVGRLSVGETAVVLAASAPHRAEAFEACRRLIDGLKDRVPIFKREIFADGTESWPGIDDGKDG